MNRIKNLISILAALIIAILTSSCVKEPQPVFPPPVITFSNDYTSSSYFQTYRVYQDTTVFMPNKAYMTASCSSLAGIDETEVKLNGIRVHYQKEQFQNFNREIDTLYKPEQKPHVEDWVFKMTDKQKRVATREIIIKIK